MSREKALTAIHLETNGRPAHTEYSLTYHHDYIRKITGMNPTSVEARRMFFDYWDMDFTWNSNDGLLGQWADFGRATDMGHAEYAADGSDMHQSSESPFHTPEEVWEFDAVKEYGLPDYQDQVAAYEDTAQHARQDFPNQLTTGGYYKSIITGAIEAFGWDMLLMAASNLPKFEKVLDSFFQRTLFHMKAWADTSVEAVIQHDDFVWTSGPFIKPDFYRQAIIPRYAELWKPLHEKGKRVLFCSDGLFTMFMDEVADAGADGFIFEPCNPFEEVVNRFGSSHCLVGSAVDCRDLTFGTEDDVKRKVDQTLNLKDKCKGLIFATGNHLPANIPSSMMEAYLTYLKTCW